MVEVNVNPGVCGFPAKINVVSEDMQIAVIKAETECPYVKSLVDSLPELDAFEECLGKFATGEVMQKASLYLKHAACPVASAILKGIEVECGLALPRNVEFEIAKK